MSLPAPAGRDYKPHNARRRPLAMTSFSVAPTNPSRSRGVAAASSSRLLLVVRPPSSRFCRAAAPVARLPAPPPLPLPPPEPGTRTQPLPPPRPTRSPAPQPRLAAAMADPKYADLPGIVSTGPGPAPQTAPPTSRGPPTPSRSQPATPPAGRPFSAPRVTAARPSTAAAPAGRPTRPGRAGPLDLAPPFLAVAGSSAQRSPPGACHLRPSVCAAHVNTALVAPQCPDCPSPPLPPRASFLQS